MLLKDLLKIVNCSNKYKISVMGNQCGYVYTDNFVNNNLDLFWNARVECFLIRDNYKIEIHICQNDITKDLILED